MMAGGCGGRSNKGTIGETEDRTTQATSSAPSSLVDGSLRSAALAANFPDTSSDGSAASRIRHMGAGIQDVDWARLWLGSRLYPYCCIAHCTEDIYLLAAFLRLSEVSEIDGDSVKLLFRTLKFMRLCDYTVEDICSILAHTSSYFIDTWTLCGSQMDASEVGNVLATLIFIAHCYVQDETCPLHIWHKHLFRKYCPLKTLNAAVIRLLQIRHYLLRLSNDELAQRYDRLIKALRLPKMRRYYSDDGSNADEGAGVNSQMSGSSNDVAGMCGMMGGMSVQVLDDPRGG